MVAMSSDKHKRVQVGKPEQACNNSEDGTTNRDNDNVRGLWHRLFTIIYYVAEL
jgi:hypothetical protein